MKEKIKFFFTLSLVLLLGYFFLKSKNEVNSLRKRGVFILGYKIHISDPGGADGDTFKYGYVYKNKIYTRRFTSFPKHFFYTDSLIFLQILPDQPEVCRQIETISVPKCLTLKSVPSEGWALLPVDSCR